MASLVYGFIRAADDGWRDSWTLAAFGAAVVLLAAFVLIESRTREPITPLRMFADRNRSGSYAIMLSLAAAMFGMFFFIVAVRAERARLHADRSPGSSFLPVSVAIFIAAGLAQPAPAALRPQAVHGGRHAAGGVPAWCG